MPNDKIAVIGEEEAVLAFKALGVDVYGASDSALAREQLKKCARTYSVVLLSERFCPSLEDLIKRYKARPYPIVLPIPSANGSLGYGLAGVKSDVEKAIGTDILFQNEKKES